MIIPVEGATGFLDTNYQGKVNHALTRLEKDDFVLLHVEAPDEASHIADLDAKRQAIEEFDARIIGPLVAALGRFSACRMLVMPDHTTPLAIRTHSRDLVPFVLYPPTDSKPDRMQAFSEREAKNGAYRLESGVKLFRVFVHGVV